MIKKIEDWLRRLMAAEVRVVDHSVSIIETRLEEEREKMSNHAATVLNSLEAYASSLLQEFKQGVVNEAAVVLAEKNKLIAELHEKVAALEETTHKIAHWKADSSTVESDHSLKLVK